MMPTPSSPHMPAAPAACHTKPRKASRATCKRFGEAIRAARKKLGLSGRDIQLLTGISRPHLSQVETGDKMLGVQHWPALAKVLRVPEATVAEWAGACAVCGGTGVPPRTSAIGNAVCDED